MSNAYNTDDPQTLLQLKRLEAAALLDVVRSFNNAEHNISTLCRITSNTLLAQLQVRKMIFLYEEDINWIEGIRVGFRAISDNALAELLTFSHTSKVVYEKYPHLHELGVEYVVPVVISKELKAIFLVADFAESEMETRNDLMFIETLSNILSFAIRLRKLYQAQVNEVAYQKELEVAGAIQNQLLISDFSRFQEVEVHAINLPQQQVGGDFYDIIKKEKGTTLVCIADVAGKGMGAALLMANLQANLRALSAQFQDLESIVFELNRILYGISNGEKFVTLFLAKIDSSNRKLSYVNVGHNYPVFVGKDILTDLESNATVLGILPELKVSSITIPFQTGDLLFMYTDGVVEQFDDGQRTMFGTERLNHILRSVWELSARESAEAVLSEIKSFAGNAPVHDDITLLSVKFL